MTYIQNADKYPHITNLINSGGGLSIEAIPMANFIAIAFDEGGTIWVGKDCYDSIEVLLDDAEKGIKRWSDKR